MSNWIARTTKVGLMFALLGSTSAFAQTGPWKLSETSGQVAVGREGATKIAIRGQNLNAGDTIRTGPRSRAVVTRGEQYMIVAADSHIRLAEPQKDGMVTQVFNYLGNVLFKVDKRKDKHFRVETPYMAAVVKGTTFNVTVGAQGTTVQVTEGAVEVSTLDGGAVDLLRPGMIGMVEGADPFAMTIMGDTTRRIESPNRGAAVPIKPTAGRVSSSAVKSVSVISQSIANEPVQLAALTNGLISGHSPGIVNSAPQKSDVPSIDQPVLLPTLEFALSTEMSNGQNEVINNLETAVISQRTSLSGNFVGDGNNGGGNDAGGPDPSNPGQGNGNGNGGGNGSGDTGGDGNNGGGNDAGGADPSNPGQGNGNGGGNGSGDTGGDGNNGGGNDAGGPDPSNPGQGNGNGNGGGNGSGDTGGDGNNGGGNDAGGADPSNPGQGNGNGGGNGSGDTGGDGNNGGGNDAGGPDPSNPGQGNGNGGGNGSGDTGGDGNNGGGNDAGGADPSNPGQGNGNGNGGGNGSGDTGGDGNNGGGNDAGGADPSNPGQGNGNGGGNGSGDTGGDGNNGGGNDAGGADPSNPGQGNGNGNGGRNGGGNGGNQDNLASIYGPIGDNNGSGSPPPNPIMRNGNPQFILDNQPMRSGLSARGRGKDQ
ncbi:FecR family protein [Parasphingorhabdus sp.]|uniref:FecR family protein n=1 Tax=Parasphingorhabdus sp. TaxID=2709688 RepID=UPI003D2C39CB